MGEKIRDLSSFQVGAVETKIELNDGYDTFEKYDIHIQSDAFQIGLTDREFMRFAAVVIDAKKKLNELKGMTDV